MNDVATMSQMKCIAMNIHIRKTKVVIKLNNSDIKILVVDDESSIRRIIRLLLEKKGYSVLEAGDGASALGVVQNEEVHLVIMDIMMPKMTGIQATEKIRELSTLPVLFLTAKSLDRDKESAYVSGGDDYLVKPFSSSELIMKVEALLRRYMIYKGRDAENKYIHIGGDVSIDVKSRQVYKDGVRVDLRDRESDILFFLYEHRGEVLDTKSIYEAVWGEAALQSGSNNVMVNMLNLRKKLEDDSSSPRVIKTVWGRGYVIEK